MKYLITGGAGFIGSNFVHHLFEKYPECEVTILDKLTYAGNLENLSEFVDKANFKFINGDICDSVVVNSLVPNCDVVVHFAAESHVDRSVLDPSSFVRTNVLGTQVLLEAVLKHKKRIHHVSTDEVFGSLTLDSGE